jgi:hypothetical protein
MRGEERARTEITEGGEGRARTEITEGGEGMEYSILWPSRALRVLTILGELGVSAFPHLGRVRSRVTGY